MKLEAVIRSAPSMLRRIIGSEGYQNLAAKRGANTPICKGHHLKLQSELKFTTDSFCFSILRVPNTRAELLPLRTSPCATRNIMPIPNNRGERKESPNAFAGVN